MHADEGKFIHEEGTKAIGEDCKIEGAGGLLDGATKRVTNRLIVGVPVTGLVRIEWAMARYGQTTPTNWSHRDYLYWMDQISPINHNVADARNMVVHNAVAQDFEWLLFIDHDVVLPPGAFLMLNQYIRKAEFPLVNGLYFTKGYPAEPLIYRGLGNGFFDKWVFGDRVMADAAGMGCTLIHGSLLKEIHSSSETYELNGRYIKRVFETPRHQIFNATTRQMSSYVGTEDIRFYRRLVEEGIYERAGWPEFQKKEYPILVDTNLFCRHIDNRGRQYPIAGEEREFFPKGEAEPTLSTMIDESRPIVGE